MMQIIHCDECGGSNIDLDAVSVNVELAKHHHCPMCYGSKDDKTLYFFCSQRCFERYIKKVYLGEAEFKWDRHGHFAKAQVP